VTEDHVCTVITSVWVAITDPEVALTATWYAFTEFFSGAAGPLITPSPLPVAVKVSPLGSPVTVNVGLGGVLDVVTSKVNGWFAVALAVAADVISSTLTVKVWYTGDSTPLVASKVKQ
jgi:hypothetical protein